MNEWTAGRSCERVLRETPLLQQVTNRQEMNSLEILFMGMGEREQHNSWQIVYRSDG